ncbi:hypothetical protein ACOTEZ_16690, partial [Achromobacter xylosoxidans]
LGGLFLPPGRPKAKTPPPGAATRAAASVGGLSLPPAAPVPAAFERLASGRHFGKIVIRVDA